ncbi:MAG: hypothetical protein SFU56_08655 [Capsulimonadales bacterium]|nr:hypothetical protein [Capsulimonadales bacterium]
MARLIPETDDDEFDGTPEADPQTPSRPAAPLPDPRLLLFGVLKRWYVVVFFGVLSYYGGLSVGGQIGTKKSFEAETIVRYQATGENSRYVDQKTTILTLKDTVKIRENIEEVRDRLGIKDAIGQIGKALDVRVQKNTTLLIIGAKWKTARGAAEMVNTLRDLFLEKYEKRRKDDLRRQIADLASRLAAVRADLRKRDRDLQRFTTSNRIVDIEKQSRALLEEFNNYGVLLEQAQAEKKTVDQQARKLDQAINELKARVARESRNMAQLENLADVNTRIERIRDTIREDKELRANIAELALRKQEMERMKGLLDRGFVSEMAYQRVVTEYETQRIRTEDNEETRKLREEREKLQQQIIPRDGGTAPSAPILTEMLKRTFEIQLDQIAVNRKVASLTEARARVKVQLDRVPILQQQFDALQRNINSREAERKELETSLAGLQRDLDSRMDDFTIVSVAEVDKEEASAASKTQMVGYVLCLVGTLLGIAVAGGWEFLDVTIRTPGQVAAKLPTVPLLGAFPRRRKRRAPLVTPDETDFSERLSITARKLRQAMPRSGGCVLVVSANPGEGVGTISRNLAAALSRQDERVALIDLRPNASEDVARWVTGGRPNVGLSEYLEGAAVTEEALVTTAMPGLSVIVRDVSTLSPDRLGSQRMASLIDGLSRRHDVALLTSAPLLKSNETQLLMGKVDGVLLVVQAGKTSVAQIEKARQKLEEMRAPVIGIVLNKARWPYIHWE